MRDQLVKRAAAYTPAECSFLKERFKTRPEIHTKENCKAALIAKKLGWQIIAEEYNSVPTHTHRTVPQIKKFFENWKTAEKKKIKSDDRMLMDTDGGPTTNNGRGIVVDENGTAVEDITKMSRVSDSNGVSTMDRLVEDRLAPFEFIEVSSYSEMSGKLKNLMLVEEIEKHPILYNFHLPGYSDKHETDEAWEEVGKVVNLTAIECRKRWKNIIAVFSRYMKFSQNGTKPKKAHYLASALNFAIPYIKVLENLYEAPEEEEGVYYTVECDGDQLAESPPPSPILVKSSPCSPAVPQLHQSIGQKCKKRLSEDEAFVGSIDKKPKEHAGSKKEALKMFMYSMIPDLMEMDDQEVRQFKRKALDAVDDILTARSTHPNKK